MTRINRNSIKKKVAKQAQKKLSKFLTAKVNSAVQIEKMRFLEGFNNHPITQEIEGGSRMGNISMTLGGYGNLFSFLGFNEGSNPISPLRRLLADSIKLKRIKGSSKVPTFTISITMPTEEQIAAATPLHWAKGKSWVEAVEEGFGGLGQYFYDAQKRMGRSGSAIEASTDLGLRPERSSPAKYISELLRKLIQGIEVNLNR